MAFLQPFHPSLHPCSPSSSSPSPCSPLPLRLPSPPLYTSLPSDTLPHPCLCASRLAPAAADCLLQHRAAGHGSAVPLHRRQPLVHARRRSSLLISSQFEVAERVRAVTPSAPPATASALSEVTSNHSDTFQNVTSEKELLLGIRKEVEAKRVPPKAGYGMEELYYNYRDAVSEGGLGEEETVRIMATVLDRILLQFEDPFTFPSYHKAIREPYDYYAFGQNYICPLLNFRDSFLGNTARFDEVEQQLKEGHNVVLFANHQTEADPAVMALLLESSHQYLAENLTYIAGDRVVLDPFCKPFSMGRNLLCVYSKKHINDVPELVDMKWKANARSLKELALLLRKGGQLVWIAPSGGRDRPDPVTRKWAPASFDAASVENMRRLIEHSRSPGHIYPLALLCHNIMPPPLEVEKEIGERRLLGYSGVAMSIGGELDFKSITADCKSPDEACQHFSQTVWECVNSHYAVLEHAVHDKVGLAASTTEVTLSQPWLQASTAFGEGRRVSCKS